MSSALDTKDTEKYLAELLPKLHSGRVTYFPIRHHSPACALRIEKWISENKPEAILIEGPSSFTSRIPMLLDERTSCPVAIYTSFVDKKKRHFSLIKSAIEAAAAGSAQSASGELSSNEKQENSEDSSKSEGPPELQQTPDSKKEASDSNSSTELSAFLPRFAAYYPFCDYSPELVALKAGNKSGSLLRFIDLEYAEMVLTEHRARLLKLSEPVKIELLTEDGHLRHSKYLKELAYRLGCRDFDELWDHLFESNLESMSTEAFIERLATYCLMSRLDYSDEELALDGTNAREACMAASIVETMAKVKGKILVVTGGFHTVVLPDLVEKAVSRPDKPDFEKDEVGSWLIRYSFNQLDALAGYASGMPAPGYYDRTWNAAHNPQRDSALANIAAELLVEIGRISREQKFSNQISTPDTIAAMQMTLQLAALRGHSWPMREDIVDGIRACFVKGELNVEGQLLMRVVHQAMSGNKIGDIPPGGDLPPIFDDFYKEANSLRITLKHIETKEHKLELYRSEKDREVSRFFHRLTFLEIDFAHLINGPDFVHGRGLELIIERWESRWSPLVEGRLMDISVLGSTIEEAANTKFLQILGDLEKNAEARSTSRIVELLNQSMRLGLHDRCEVLIPLLDKHIAEDPSFYSVTNGVSQIELLYRAREPLGASRVVALPKLMQTAYERSTRLLEDLHKSNNDQLEENLRAMLTLKEVLSSEQAIGDEEPELEASYLDPSLFFGRLNALVCAPPQQTQAPIVGAAAGILFTEGKISEQELIDIILGYLGAATTDPTKSTGILRGLLHTACEIAWQLSSVIQAFDQQFRNWDEETFVDLLPDLRLAFSALIPRDISRVAEIVSNFYGESSLGELINMDVDEGSLRYGIAINKIVEAALSADGINNHE